MHSRLGLVIDNDKERYKVNIISTKRGEGMRQNQYVMFVITLFCVLLSSPTESWSKGRSKKSKSKIKPSAVSEEVLKVARGVYQDLNTSPDLNVRIAITKGMIELGGEDREKALDQAFRAADLELKLLAFDEVLSHPKIHKKRKISTMKMFNALLEAENKKDFEVGVMLLKRHFRASTQTKKWRSLLKSKSPFARRAARLKILSEKGKNAWKLIKKGLKEPLNSKFHQDVLSALRETRYQKAAKWAISHASDSNADGEVARLWISKATGKFARNMNKKLIKQYRKAEGDFPRRVRLAHLLASRGKLLVVIDTLVVAVKDKKGRVDEDLDTAELRVMGWEGLKSCRNPKVLAAVKPMMVNIKNRVEAAPAVDWLAAWVADTRDPTAMQILEDMVKQTQYISRVEAIRALGSLKLRKSWGLLESALAEGNKDLRYVAAEALSLMATKGDEKAFHTFLQKEKDLQIREVLFKGVIRIGTMKTYKTIKYWLRSSKNSLRSLAIDALTRLGVSRKELEKQLSGKLRNDTDLQIRLKVWTLLMEAESKSLKKRFKDAARWMTPKDVQTLAKNSKIPNKLFQTLALDGDKELSAATMKIFEERREAALIDLEKVMKESVEPVTTAEALRIYTDVQKERGVSKYKEMLTNDHGEVRALAIDALRVYGDIDMIKSIRDLIENERDPHPRVQAVRTFVGMSIKAAKIEKESKKGKKKKGKK